MPRLKGALSSVTAAVVGVILNLSSIEYDDAEVVRTDLDRFPLDAEHTS